MTGALKGLQPLRNGNTYVSLEIDGDYADYIERLQDVKLNIDIKKYFEKRSLNANAYYHVLCGKIAEAIGSSMTEVCNKMIAEYGQIDKELGCLIINADIDYTKIETIHLRQTTKTQVMADGKLYRCYWVMRGSHTYDKKEMHTLIQGVIWEAEQIGGIETLTPTQLHALLDKWEEQKTE